MEPSEVLFQRALDDIDETLSAATQAHRWVPLPFATLEQAILRRAVRSVEERRQALEKAWGEVLGDQDITAEERERRKQLLAFEALSVAQGAHESVPGAPPTPPWLAEANAILFGRRAEAPEPPVSIVREMGEQVEGAVMRAVGAAQENLPSLPTTALVVGGIAAVGLTVYVVTRRCR